MRRKRTNDEAMKGIDTITFSMTTSQPIQATNLELITVHGNKYGYVQIFSNRIECVLNMPKARGTSKTETNLVPFSLYNRVYIEIIKQDVLGRLKEILGSGFTSQVKTCELTYCVPVESNREIDTLITLLRDTFAESKRQSSVYYIKDMDPDLYVQDIQATGYISPAISNSYRIKVYNKGRELGLERDILRVEIILMNRYLKKLLKGKTTIEDVLSAETVAVLINEYKKIYEKSIAPALGKRFNQVVEELYYRMVETKKITRTFLELREHVYCLEVFIRAYRRYAKENSVSDNAVCRMGTYIKKKYGLDNTVLELLRQLHDNC